MCQHMLIEHLKSEIESFVTWPKKKKKWKMWLICFRFQMSERKAVIKNADMSEEMQQDAVDCATQALEKYNIEKDIAAYIKKVTKKKTA